ncbi:B2MG protein, partial [Upupa epops]|nr:B2MG protein [Upupa epops]
AAGAMAVVPRMLLLLGLIGLVRAGEVPKVEVYSRHPADSGQRNTLICYVSGFHPPQINITLLKNGEPMSDVKYTDMSFNDKWLFQRMAYTDFIPKEDDLFVCRVAHSTLSEPQSYRW